MTEETLPSGALAPGSPEWAGIVTASKVAAILGVAPEGWESRRSLWLKMRGEVPWDDGQNASAKARGHWLENGVLDWWCDRHRTDRSGFERQVVVTRPDLPWASATPDLVSYRAHVAGEGFCAAEPVVVDAKTSRDDSEWGAAGTDDIPPWYAAQLVWAMHLSGARVGYVALLTQFLDLREYRVEYDQDLASDMVEQCRAFWESLSDPDAMPPVDSSPATWRAERLRHPDVDRDLTVELDVDLASRFVSVRSAQADVRLAESQVREAMGAARLATCRGVTVARRQANGHGSVSLVAVARSIPEEAAA
ncbi:MAG: YqaJ viral recombinase family protein [Micrococcales bacterium]|nr:YqaJ viral recombinase family protein [Micrococcales bacterium]